VKSEPYETLTIDVPPAFSGKAIELVTQRKGEMIIIEPKGDLTHLEFDFRQEADWIKEYMLTATAGEP